MKKVKSLKFVVGTNSLANTTQVAYANHMQMWFLLGKRYPQHQFCFVNPPRMSIDRMRNLCAKTAQEIGADYILFLDDDVLIPNPFDFLEKLLAAKAHVAAGDVLVRGYPFNHMIFRYVDKDKRAMKILDKIPKKKGVIPCDAVGFSLCLIDAKVLEKVPEPFFITGPMHTEDVYFCIKAGNHIKDLKVVCDTSITCGHILGPEVIDENNKHAYKRYHEAVFGNPGSENGDRGEEYLSNVKRTITAQRQLVKTESGMRKSEDKRLHKY